MTTRPKPATSEPVKPGKRLRYWRQKQLPTMPQRALAEEVGCSRQTISNLESAGTKARREHVLVGIERVTEGFVKVQDWFA